MLTGDLQHFLAGLEADASLYEPGQIRARLDALDRLEMAFGDFLPGEVSQDPALASIRQRAKAVRNRLESVNFDLYASIRSEVKRGAHPHAILPWIQASDHHGKSKHPASGLSYDFSDEALSGILQLREPARTDIRPDPESVFYQPTPVRHILQLITVSALSETDVLVDLGSGLGHVPMLVSILSGVRSVGIELEASYVAIAQECAERLSLTKVSFVQQDARLADLSSGTVFYLYTPFTGSILANVLDRLRQQSNKRSIKIITLGPCTSIVAMEPWLRASAPPDPGQITLFHPLN